MRNSFYSNAFWVLMALYLLNISVDPIDPEPSTLPEDLSINDQESIVEIVVEEILGFEDAIREYDDPDTENNYKKTSLKIDLITQGHTGMHLPGLFAAVNKRALPPVATGLTTGFQQLNTPPPKS